MDKKVIIILLYLIFYLTIGELLFIIPFLFLNLKKNNKFIFYSFKNIIMSSLSFLIMMLYPIKINVNSIKLLEKINSYSYGSKKNIIISNHISELDPFFMTIIFNNPNNFFSNIILISKKILGYFIPSFGLIGLFTNDIFLHRNIEQDIYKLEKKLDFNKIFFYPEGTCFNHNRKLNSDYYCYKNNLPIFKYHLYPRIKGFELILNNNSDISYIYDLTFFYDTIHKENFGNHYNFISFVNKFKFPTNVYININRYKINNNKNIKKKLENIFINKDKFIKKFNIENNDFITYKYNFNYGLTNFILINIICITSFYLFYKLIIFRYIFLLELFIYFFYFYFYI